MEIKPKHILVAGIIIYLLGIFIAWRFPNPKATIRIEDTYEYQVMLMHQNGYD